MDWPLYASLFQSYLITIAIEAPILWVALAPVHRWPSRLFAGVWLTACTYPLLGLVLPLALDPHTQRGWYALVGETLVPLAECLLFWVAFIQHRQLPRRVVVRDMAAIVLANLVSYGLPELYYLFYP
jgi:hypothetical protein